MAPLSPPLKVAALLCAVGLAALAGRVVATHAPFRFAEATIDDLQARMAAGSLTSVELTRSYLDRIRSIDRAGPRLNAVIEVNPEAMAIAERLDAERAAGRVRGPLHGIPILIKDNIATADRMQTTAGSLALVGAKPPRDAALVRRLREAGAVILGKTNLSEWANFRGEHSVSGWSGRGGQTHNPYALDRSPSGSSSGSAAAVSANLCVAAIGTETSGSIIAPSSACGVVGVKPTVGAVSRSGIIPISATFDTAGAIARTPRDAALVLAAIAGADPHDVATQEVPATFTADLAAPLAAHALRGARLGLVRNADARPNMDAALTSAMRALRAAGAEVVDVGEFPELKAGRDAAFTVMLYEIKPGVDAYLQQLGPASRMKSLADVIRFNDAHWAQEQPLFGQQYLIRAEAMDARTDAAYRAALATCHRVGAGGIDALLAEHHLDALVAIANAPASLIAQPESGDPLFGPRGPGGIGYPAAAMAGYPSVTVPLTDISGLPVGLLFYGRAWSDARLLALAADFDAQIHARREPRFLATASTRPAP